MSVKGMVGALVDDGGWGEEALPAALIEEEADGEVAAGHGDQEGGGEGFEEPARVYVLGRV